MVDKLKYFKQQLHILSSHGFYQKEIARWISNRKKVKGFSQPSLSRLRATNSLTAHHVELIAYLEEIIEELKENNLFFEDLNDLTNLKKKEIKRELFKENTKSFTISKQLTRIPVIDLDREFLGRSHDMQQLKDNLDKASKVVLMNGLGGIGKTLLATAFVQQYHDNYDHLVWINRGENLIDSIALNEDLADALEFPIEKEQDMEMRFRNILHRLHQLPGHNLLVIDNAQEQVAQKGIYEFLPGLPNWQVLLTSRLKLNGFDLFPLDILPPKDAHRLFRMHYKSEYTDKELERLLKEVSYHTLTVELLAKLMDKLNNLLSVPELTEILQKKQLNNSDLQEKIWVRHSGEERGIYIHLMKAFELTKLSDEEKWMLKQFVFLPVEAYFVPTLVDFLGKKKPFQLNTILNSLAAKGWLTLSENKTFSIHRLIRQVVEYQLQPAYEDGEALLEGMILKLDANAYTNQIKENIPWLKYALDVENFLVGKMHRSLAIAVLQNNIAETYRPLGQYKDALNYHKKAITIRELMLDAKHPDLAHSYNNFALTYRDLEQYENALAYHLKALEIRESILHLEDSDLAYFYNNIGLTYRDLEQYENALVYHLKALEIRKLSLDAQHPDLAASHMDIGVVYWTMKQYKKALSYHKKAVAIYEFSVDALHPCLAKSYNNIANTHRDLKQYKDALYFHKKAITIRESIPNNQHPDLAASYIDIALTYKKLEQQNEAEAYEAKADSINLLQKGF